MDAPCLASSFWASVCVSGYRGPKDCPPPRSFFTRTFLPFRRFSLRPLGPAYCIGELEVRRMTRNDAPPAPTHSSDWTKGKRCPFFAGLCFGECLCLFCVFPKFSLSLIVFMEGFRRRTLGRTSLCCSVVVCLFFLHICWGFLFPKMLGKTLFFLVLILETHFRAPTFVLLSSCCLVLFCGVLPMFLHISWAFCSGIVWQFFFFLGLVFEVHFRARTFVFVVLLRSSAFR